MSIDMEQFKVTFVEESREGLATMESILLDMHPGETDAEAIDDRDGRAVPSPRPWSRTLHAEHSEEEGKPARPARPVCLSSPGRRRHPTANSAGVER